MSEATRRPNPDPVVAGQESVWDYPRPPAVVTTDEEVAVEFAGVTIAHSRDGLRVLETSHPPTYYLPGRDVRLDLLVPSKLRTFCEFKGWACYADLVVGDDRSGDACWWYPRPAVGYEQLADHIAFYPGRVDNCWVDGERVDAQDGDYYGAWITSRVAGPFKGAPGTAWW